MRLVVVNKGVEEILRYMDMLAVEYETCRSVSDKLDWIFMY